MHYITIDKLQHCGLMQMVILAANLSNCSLFLEFIVAIQIDCLALPTV